MNCKLPPPYILTLFKDISDKKRATPPHNRRSDGFHDGIAIVFCTAGYMHCAGCLLVFLYLQVALACDSKFLVALYKARQA